MESQLSRDIMSKLKYVQHIYKGQNEMLLKVLEAAIERRHPYGKRLLTYKDFANLGQLS